MENNKIEEIQIKITQLIDEDGKELSDPEYVALLVILNYEITSRLDAVKNSIK